jgi:hypothetical protein
MTLAATVDSVDNTETMQTQMPAPRHVQVKDIVTYVYNSYPEFSFGSFSLSLQRK